MMRAASGRILLSKGLINVELAFSWEINLKAADVQALYDDAGWSVYTKDMEKLMRALNNSLAVVTAWDKERLVGLVRVVGDGETILYIQDILVLVAYKRKGIGRELLAQIFKKFPVRQKVLLTDDTPEARGFYEALGFISGDKGDTVAFVKFD
jgi:ribosomal protein S18 acetylase RimI-like enzyme